MVVFLERLAEKWRKSNPKVILLFQNSHGLYEDKRIMDNYNGIVQEGLFASWAEEKVDKTWQKEKIKELSKIKKAGKFVGILEYTRKRLQMKEISEKAAKLGFLPCFSTRDLDKVFPDF